MKRERKIFKLIQNSFLKSVLIPIFTIEVLLLVIYFSINSFISSETEKRLLDEVRTNIREIVSREARIINNQLNDISKSAELLQKQNSDVLKNPDYDFIRKSSLEFTYAENGVFYKTTEGGSSLFYASNTEIGESERNKSILTEKFDLLYKTIQESRDNIVSIYFNTYDNMNRYYPYIPEVYSQFPAELQMTDFNFYYEGNETYNPERKVVWTDVYLDPAGLGWMTSCIVPVYNGDFLEGVIGLDITIEKFVSNILNLELPWGSNALLLNRDGVIIAMPKELESIFGVEELQTHSYNGVVEVQQLKPDEFNLLKNRDIEVKRVFTRVIESGSREETLRNGDVEYIVISDSVPETEWTYSVLVNKSIVFAQIYELEELSNQIGYLAIVGMVLFYIILFFALSKRSRRLASVIARPIQRLVQATQNIGDTIREVKLNHSSIIEIDELSRSFQDMSKKLLESYNQQQELNRTLEIKVEERTADLQEAKKTIEASHKSMEDSIKFASLIQTAILPAPAILDSYTSENFILWQPKDTVGGDIYLTMELDDEVFILVFDGAGHGVHGAFVTMLVKAIENQLSAKLKSGEIEKSPAKMLEYFNIAFKLMLKQDKQFHSRKDNISNAGFDGAILYYKRGSKQLIFSGAKSQVFTLNGESIEMYKGDRANVGFFRTKMNQKFSDKIIPLEDNTTIYITTDGYLDQWVPEKENIFGSDSFSELILENRNTPLQEQRAVFTDTLESLLLNGEQIDDITVIALKF